MMSAALIDPRANAKQHAVVIQTETDGVRIVDPASARYVPRLDEAHFRYQVDGDTPVDSTNTRIEFRELGSGEHLIHVWLVGNDNRPVGEPQTLKVHVP